MNTLKTFLSILFLLGSSLISPFSFAVFTPSYEDAKDHCYQVVDTFGDGVFTNAAQEIPQQDVVKVFEQSAQKQHMSKKFIEAGKAFIARIYELINQPDHEGKAQQQFEDFVEACANDLSTTKI